MSNMDQVVYPPAVGEGQRIAVTITGAATALETRIKGMGWLRVLARGCNVQVGFGAAATPLPVFDSVTAAEIGYTILNGTYHDFWLRGTELYILWDADGSGYIDLDRAGTERVKTVV